MPFEPGTVDWERARRLEAEARVAELENDSAHTQREANKLARDNDALRARIAALEAALDEATDLLAMVGTEPLDKFRALIRPLNLPPKAAQILADNLENFS